jgi:hypothetical protein
MKDSDDFRQAQRDEHALWVDLINELVRVGAITEADKASSVRQNVTKGQRLLNTIRRWGDAKQNLGRGE